MATRFTRLLLATEHSEFDTGAEALALAMGRHCALPLACVLPLVSNAEFEMVAPQLAERADAEASRKREALEAMAAQAGVALQVHVRRGPEPFAEIVDEARALHSELLIIRRRGRRGLLANLLVGEMVSKVVAHAPCSVLVTPRQARMWQRRVLLGLDPQAADPEALALACAVAAECGLPLQLVCVVGGAPARDAAQRVLDAALVQARGQLASADGELRQGRPHEELLAAAQACGADLIVIGRHGRSNLGRAWIGGVAQKVIGLGDCPVLVHVPANPAAPP